MTVHAVVVVVVFFGLLIALGYPLGMYMARVYEGKARIAQKVLGPVERLFYRISGVRPEREMNWKRYLFAMLVFNLFGLLVVYVLQRLQGVLPVNPAGMKAISPHGAFSVAVSFATNTNWQWYSGEAVMSHFTQMLALTVQNFVSAATGIAVLVALIRGFARRQTDAVGNFWVDLTKTTLYVLMPLSFLLAIVLVSQGVVQNLKGPQTATLVEGPVADGDGNPVAEQKISVGPAASQVAIKQWGTNGGGFYNVNSAHPLENPTPFSNLLETLAILLISTAVCFTFGHMVKDKRQGWAVLAAMLVILVPLTFTCIAAEQTGNPNLSAAGADQSASDLQPGGNMEGKEVRFGPAESGVWASWTTAASNGSVNSMHDSFTPLGGLVPMWLMQLGEQIFGGVGSGLYGMLVFAIVAVFIAGLMVGRTPEYLGKKIEAYEMKMASLVILLPAAAVLLGTAAAIAFPSAIKAAPNPGAHKFSEILYAFSSAGNNNGSAFAGLDASGKFYTIAQGIAMLIGRYWVTVPVMALAGSLARKKLIPASAGTLPTHRPLFVFLLAGVVILVGALTFIPALALGPIVEHFQMVSS